MRIQSTVIGKNLQIKIWSLVNCQKILRKILYVNTHYFPGITNFKNYNIEIFVRVVLASH